jgi:hypothetical protein
LRQRVPLSKARNGLQPRLDRPAFPRVAPASVQVTGMAFSWIGAL